MCASRWQWSMRIHSLVCLDWTIEHITKQIRKKSTQLHPTSTKPPGHLWLQRKVKMELQKTGPPVCSEELVEVLTSAGFAAPQIEALKAGFPRLGVVDLHSFAYVRKALDPNGINSDHEREYSAGKVPRRGPVKQPTAPSLTLSPRSRHRCCAMPRSITPPWSLTRSRRPSSSSRTTSHSKRCTTTWRA